MKANQKDINAGFLDDTGRTLAMTLLQNFTEKTIDQLKFIGENTNIDFKAVDNAGMNVIHYLAFHKRPTEHDADDEEEIISEKEDKNDDFPDEDEKMEDDEKNDEDENDEDQKKKSKKDPKELMKQRNKKHNLALIKAAEYLISKGVDYNLQSENGTPLLLAIENQNNIFAQWLLKKGVSIKGKNCDNESLLHLLIKSVRFNGITKFLKAISEIENYKILLNEIAPQVAKTGETFTARMAKILIKTQDNEIKSKKRILELMEFLIKSGVDMGICQGMNEEGQKKCEKKKEEGCSEAEIQRISLTLSKDNKVDKRWRRRQKIMSYRNKNRNQNNKDKNAKSKIIKDSLKSNKIGFLNQIEGKNTKKIKFEYYDSKTGLCNILHLLVKYLPINSEIAEPLFKLLSTSGANFDTKNLQGITPFILAVLLNKRKFAQLLLNFKFDPNATNNETQKVSAMHLAAATMDSQIMQEMINRGGNVNCIDALGNTPLHYAAGLRNLETATILLKNKANVNALNNEKNTPLHISFSMYETSKIDSSEFEDLLFKHGADFNIENLHGRTPFFHAFIKASFMGKSKCGVIDPIELVMKALSIPKLNLSKQDIKGNTVLHLACREGAILSVLTMIKAGAKLDIQNNKKNTPLGNAFSHERAQLCIYLLQETVPNQHIYIRKLVDVPKDIMTKAKIKEYISEGKKAYEKFNSFHYAAALNDDGIMFLLRKQGFPAHKAFKVAIAMHEVKLAIKILDQDKDSLAKYHTKKTNMNLHCYFALYSIPPNTRDEESMKDQKILHEKLISLGINPFEKSKDGLTSVHAAAKSSNIPLLKDLLTELPADEFKKIICEQAKINEKSSTFYNIISYYVFLNQKIPKHIGVSNLKLYSRLQDFVIRVQNEKDEPNDLCYILQLCQDKKISIPTEISINLENRDETDFDTFWIYSHLFENVKILKTTLLHIAVMYNNSRLAILLVGMGCDINAKDSEGRTPIMYAVLQGILRPLDFLLNTHEKYGHKQTIDLDIRDNQGKTALIYCAEPCYLEKKKSTILRHDVLKRLLDAKASLAIKDNTGKNLIDYINELPNNESLVEVLKKHNPKLTLKLNSAELKPNDTIMAEKPEFDYNQDCEEYLKKKFKKMEDVKSPDGCKKPKVDSVAKLGGKAEIVKGDKYYYDALMAKIDVKKYLFGVANFYKVQLIHDKTRSIYLVWTRWGRIGDEGEYQRTPFKTLEEAAKEFKKIFKQKTGNNWDNVDNFEKKPKKHSLKELEGKSVFKPHHEIKFSCRNVDTNTLLEPLKLDKAPESKLNEQIQNLFSEIIDIKQLDSSLRSVLENNKHVALAALDFETIQEANNILEEIDEKICLSDSMKSGERSYEKYSEIMNEIYELSNKYFELLAPTGYAHAKIEPILTVDDLQMHKSQLKDIYDIEAGLKILGGAKYRIKQIHPFDYCVKALNIDLNILNENDEEFKFIDMYIQNTRNDDFPETHSYYIDSIIKVNSKSHRNPDEAKIFDKIHNHTLLWHGTSTKNLLGILAQGLRVAPFSSANHGARFGTAIYFSDNFSKSAAYSQTDSTSKFTMVLLCEVALGNIYGAEPSYNPLTYPPKNYHSIKMLPNTGPSTFVKTESGLIYPMGENCGYGPVYVEEGENRYYDLEEYKKSQSKNKKGAKKGKKIGLDFGASSKKKSKKQESEDEENSDLGADQNNEENDDVKEQKKLKEKKSAQENFLDPEFICHDNPKANIPKFEENTNSDEVTESEYLIFNGAQARVKYIVILGLNKETNVFFEENEISNNNSANKKLSLKSKNINDPDEFEENENDNLSD